MMQRRRTTRLILAASLVAAAGTPVSVWAQEGAQEPTTQTSPAADARIRFNFKDAPFDPVLDFFSRESGVPIIREAPVPAGKLTFISGEAYAFDEALSILNLHLHMHKTHLKHSGEFLYLQTMKGAGQSPDAVYQDGLPEGVTADEIVTLTIPLDNAAAADIAEKIKPLVNEEYGGVTPVPAQNMLILVETAAQARRIQQVVQEIDKKLPVDSAFRLFPLENAKAEDAVNALKGLVGERVKQIIIDKDGKQRVVEEVSVAGLNLQPDPRTNSVIAVGPESRLELVEQLIELLDAPDGMGGGEQQMITVALETITPDEAAGHLNNLFSNVPANRKPTIMPLPQVGKLTLVGSVTLLTQAVALIGEIDPGAGGDAREVSPERRTIILRLTYIPPSTAESISRRLLTARQLQVLRFTSTPDAKGLIVTGPDADVASFEQLVAGLDVKPEIDKEVRQVRITTGDVADVLAKTQDLYTQSGQAEKEPVVVSRDDESRLVTLIGSRTGLSKFESMLRSAQQNVVVKIESRSYELAQIKPSVLSPKLQRIAKPLLTPDDGTPFHQPKFESLDELDTLIVRAEPGQFAIIEGLIEQFDEPQMGGKDFRVVRMTVADPLGVIERTKQMYAQRTEGLDEDLAGPIEIEFDEATGNLLLTANRNGMRVFTDLLTQAQRLIPPRRTTRIIDIQQVQASEILGPLTEFLSSADPIDIARKVPDPTIKIVERTNSLLVTAEDAQHRLVSDYVRRLDKIDRSDLPPLKLLQLKTADVNNISSMLLQQYNMRPSADRTARPVNIRADANTNTLIVSAHEELFDEIKAFVDELNRDADGPDRVTVLFPLKVAKAEQVAQAMDKLYPQPPMPRDRYNRPMPWLQEKKEVSVSAEPNSNSLIFDAPTDRMDDLKELATKLDTVELPQVAELRTYRVLNADISSIKRTLDGMARQQILQGPPEPGKQPVKVVIESEPRSNTLIVSGDEITFDRVEKMLKELAAVPIEKGLRIIPIANVDANDVRERSLAIYDAQIAQIPDANSVEITINEDTNSLEVVADTEAMRRYMRIIDELQRQAGPARQVRMIELRFAKVGEVITFLEEMASASESLSIQGGPDPVFEPIETTNSVMVAAQPAQFSIIEQLIRSLDNQQTADRPPLRILKLRTTDAASLASILQRSYNQRPMEERSKKPADVQFDAATNTLIVSAHEDVLPEIEDIVTTLNETQALDAEGREIRIFPLRHAQAEDLAKTIDEMYPQPPVPRDRYGRPQYNLQQPKEVFVRADRGTNSLIVEAPIQRLAGFEQIVRSLDQQNPLKDIELRTYKVARAELNAVTRTLQDLANRGALGQVAQGSITINAEPMTRSLVVSGPADVFDEVERVLEELDTMQERPVTSLKMYGLEHARAERIQPLLKQLLTTRLREQELADGRVVVGVESLLDVAADNASNMLIISAPEGIQQIAEQIIESLDTEAAQVGRAVTRVVPMTYADANQTASTLTRLIPQLELPTGGRVTIMAIIGSNALLITGAQADLGKLEETIAELDVQPFDPEKPDIETYGLVHADATSIAQTVERLLKEQQQTDPRLLMAQLRYTRGRLPQQPQIRVEAERRTNSLLVSGPSKTLELAKMIIEQLDQPAEAPDRTALTFTPAKADPAQLVSTVMKIVTATMTQGRTPLELVAEPKSGSIVVLGTPEQTAQAVKLLAEFDDRAFVAPSVDLQIFDLEHADAQSISRTVQGMLADRSRWPDALRQAERAGLGIPQPTINADAKANRLIVSVPTPLMAMATNLIDTLDQPKAQAAVDVRVFKLEKGDANSVATAVRTGLMASAEPGEPTPTVTPEAASNTIVVSASAKRLAQAEELIKTMDDTIEPGGVGVRTIYLEHARAEAIAPVVEDVLTQESALDLVPEWQRWQVLARNRNMRPDGKVRIVAERRLNAIVVSAPLPVLELAEQIISELDADPTDRGPGGGRTVRILTLRNADASELSANIEAVFAEDDINQEPPTIRVDSASNSLIIRATPEQVAMIEGLAKELDAAAVMTNRQLRMIPLDRSRADAALMAQTIKSLMEQQGGVTVEVITAEELLKQHESPPGKETGDAGKGDSSFRFDVPEADHAGASHMRPWSIPQMVTAIAMAMPMQPVADDDEPAITIAVDPVSNALIIVGSQRMTDRVTALAKELEQQMPPAATKIHMVKLPVGIDARTVTNIVMQTVRQVGRINANNPSGFTGRVSAIADPSGGAVIVWANDADFEPVGQLVASLAQTGGTAKLTVKVYPLESVRARNAARAISDLVSPAPRGRQAQRMRQSYDLTVEGPDGEQVQAIVDPQRVKVVADPSGMAVIVTAPADTMPLIDQFVAVIDQSPVVDRLGIRTYELENARATQIVRTLQTLFDNQRQGPGGGDVPRVRFAADDRTNSLLLTASDEQHALAQRVIAEMDTQTADENLELKIVNLQNAQPSTVQKIVEQALIGRDDAKRKLISISVDNNTNLFAVRAPAEMIPEIERIIKDVDRFDTTGLPVRSLKLEFADAQAVAQVVQRFYQDRARASAVGRRQAPNRLAITGDSRTGTLIIAASDTDFEQIKDLVATFDSEETPKDLQFRIIALKNASVGDIEDVLNELAWQFQMDSRNRSRGGQTPERLLINTNIRTNSVILIGNAAGMDTVETVVEALDVEQAEPTKLIVKTVPVEAADMDAIARVVRQAMRPSNRPWWFSSNNDPDSVRVEVDRQRRLLILVGKKPKVEQAAEYITELAEAKGIGDRVIDSIVLEHAPADRAARSLQQFFQQRARAEGLPPQRVSVIGSRDGNVIMVAAPQEDMALLRDLIAQVDQPEAGENRQMEVYYLANAEARDVSNTIRQMFPRSQRSDDQVIATPQPSSNLVIVSAPQDRFAEIEVLIEQLDSPHAGDTSMVTVALESATASDVAEAIRSALPDSVKVQITPVARSNSLLLTGSPEAIDIVREQIANLDLEEPKALVEFRVFSLEHAVASDIAFTLGQLTRTQFRTNGDPVPSIDYVDADNTLLIRATIDQLRDIERMLAELDVESLITRETEFVKLKYAPAEQIADALKVFYGRMAFAATTPGARNVTIVPDPATNSLVISAGEAEWAGIRSLLSQLDTEEYDTERQLSVIPLLHADAQSVSRALSEGFEAGLRRQLDRARIQRETERRNQGGRRDDYYEPPVLLSSEETPSVSAEIQTNSLIVFAGRRDLERIQAIVKQLDIPDILKLPSPRLIPLQSGRASTIANSLREMFVTGNGRSSPRSVLIVGDDSSNTLIVRADEQEFAQIQVLAETIEEQGKIAWATVRVLSVQNIPATRLQQTIRQTFAPTAAQRGEQLAVSVDRDSNSLVISSSETLYKQIEETVKELDGIAQGAPIENDQAGDGPGPIGRMGLGQSVFIIDIEHNSPQQIQQMLNQLGVTRAQSLDRPGVVAEPVTIVTLNTRRAIAVVAGAADGRAIVSLVHSLDAEPAGNEQSMVVVPLKLATAQAVVQTIEQMLNPSDQDAKTGPAEALAEHIRRLNYHRNGLTDKDLTFDLAVPIRLFADAQTNSIIIGSTEGNVAAIKDLVGSLDTLPIGDAVVVRIFPLENASAARVKAVVEDLFRQGEALRRLPGTQRQGLPSTATGQALAGEIAVSVDDRTNTLIVAGREEAAAFVEVLVLQMDSSVAKQWVETRLLYLEHADASTIADSLRSVLVEGLPEAPEAEAIQRQVARLRLLQEGGDPLNEDDFLLSDMFVQMSGLVILPEEHLNALILVGTPANLAIISEMAGMLDVEAASAANKVRVFPLMHAAADRVGGMVENIFRQREQTDPSMRPEDGVIVQADSRTNSLVVSTSAKSFAVVDALLKTLDGEEARELVRVHVIPVDGADVRSLAPSIDRIMRERLEASRRAGGLESPMDVIRIEAVPPINALIVAASDENLKVVNDVLDALLAGSAEMAGSAKTELIPLESAQAVDIIGDIQTLYVERENAQRGDNAISVIANERLNMLVVNGTDEDIAAVRGLVRQLDTAEVIVTRDLKRIPIETASAFELVNLLQDILAGRPLSGSQLGAKATKIRFLRNEVAGEIEVEQGREPTEAEIDGAILDQVQLTADQRTNSILVAAPPKMLELIEDMIQDLDTDDTGVRTVRSFRLTNADARQTAELLRDLFNLRQQGNMYYLLPTGSRDGQEEDADSEATFTPVPDERQQLAISIDARTNTLFVSATEDYLEEVEKIVVGLDLIEAHDRERFVFHLRNALAGEISENLRTYFEGEANILLGLESNQGISVQEKLAREVTVVGDENSNTLIVSASPRYAEAVREIIKELDAPPPQVKIQVLLAEVTLDNTDNWGVDIDAGPFGGDDYTMGFLAAGAGVATALGVPNFSVSGANFGVLLRALEEQGKLEVLSRPEVTVNNNRQARINVGEDIAIVAGVERFSDGSSTANVERRDVGIILEVTPSISDDGFVRMEISPEISTVSQKTDQLSGDVVAPRINKRLVDTTVTVKDGETVVIGGLIQTQEEERETKVPILGDIPLAGMLFRSRQFAYVKTELLVILTPNIIPGGAADGVSKFRELTKRDIQGLTDSAKVLDALDMEPNGKFGNPSEPDEDEAPKKEDEQP